MVERCAVLLNAAAALYVAGRGWTMAEAAARAREALEDGGAARVLAELRRAAPRAEGGVLEYPRAARRRRRCHPERSEGASASGDRPILRSAQDDAATAQYFRITPTTTPWIRTSRS